MPGMPDADFLTEAVEFGLAFLVFAAGVELSPRRAGGRLRAVLQIGMAQFILLGLAGFLLAISLGFEWIPALVIALAVSASSTLVVLRHLKQRQQMFEPFGRLVTGVLLLQDLLVIGLIVVLASLPDGAWAVLRASAAVAGLGWLAYAGQRWLVPWILSKGKLDDESLLLLVLSLLFVFIGASVALGLPMVCGAFLAGFTLAAFPVNGMARGILNTLSDFFLAFFFVALGTILVLPPTDLLLKGALLALLVILLTPPLVAAITEWAGYSSRVSIETGLLLAQTSEFSLLVGLHGLMIGIIEPEVFGMITLMTVATMTLTPFLATDRITWRLMRLHPSNLRRSSPAADLHNHIVLLGYGGAGRKITDMLKDHKDRVVIIDDDAIVIQNLRKQGFTCIRGDASDDKVLSRARARKAGFVLSALRRPADIIKVLDCLRGGTAQTWVRVFDEEGAEKVRAMGGFPIVTTEITVQRFMEWMKERFQHATQPD